MGEIVEYKAKNGTPVFKLYKVDGIHFIMRFKGKEARLDGIKELKHRPGDVIIANYQKTGTHWLMDSIAMLKQGKAEVVHQTGFEGSIDFGDGFEAIEQMESPRLLMTHLYPRHLSEDYKEKAKFILLLRNPKDTAVSMYHHLCKDSQQNFTATWDDFIDLFAKGQAPPCLFFDFYRQWQDFLMSHKDQCLILYYEDMHKNYEKELRRIADFMNLRVSEKTVAAIAKKGNINTIRKELLTNPKLQALAKKMTNDGTLPFYRKGIVGDWKNHFTVAQDEMFNKIMDKEMEGLIFKYCYEVTSF